AVERCDRRRGRHCADLFGWQAAYRTLSGEGKLCVDIRGRRIAGDRHRMGVLLGAIVLPRRRVHQGLYEDLRVSLCREGGGGDCAETGQRDRGCERERSEALTPCN